MARRRRSKKHHSMENPTGAQWLMIGGAVVGVGVISYLVYTNAQNSSASNAAPAALPAAAPATTTTTTTTAPTTSG